jgi:hypothetical protein
LGTAITDEKLVDVAGGSEHLLGAGAYAHIFGEILSAYRPRVVDQELCRARDVVAVGPRRDVQQTVMTDYVQIGIG